MYVYYVYMYVFMCAVCMYVCMYVRMYINNVRMDMCVCMIMFICNYF